MIGAGGRAALVLAVVVSVTACGGGKDEAPMLSGSVPTSPTSAVDIAPVPPTTVGEASAPAPSSAPAVSTSRPRSTATTRRPTSAAVGLSPPAAGTYRYDTSGSSTSGLTTVPFPAITTLTIDPPGGTRQRSVRELRDPAGNGPQLEFLLDYRREGIFLERLKLTTTFSGFVDVRDLRPPSPALLLATGAGPGAHQSFTLSGAGGAANVAVDVLAREQVSVGGRSVEALVVRTVATLPPGDVTGRVELTTWLAPSVRLWVKERFLTEASAGGGLFQFRSQYEARLQRLP